MYLYPTDVRSLDAAPQRPANLGNRPVQRLPAYRRYVRGLDEQPYQPTYLRPTDHRLHRQYQAANGSASHSLPVMGQVSLPAIPHLQLFAARWFGTYRQVVLLDNDQVADLLHLLQCAMSVQIHEESYQVYASCSCEPEEPLCEVGETAFFNVSFSCLLLSLSWVFSPLCNPLNRRKTNRRNTPTEMEASARLKMANW